MCGGAGFGVEKRLECYVIGLLRAGARKILDSRDVDSGNAAAANYG